MRNLGAVARNSLYRGGKMKQFIIFTKKELFESVATFKLYILLALFLIFGMMSPLLAKLLPEILKSMDLAGMVIELPEPSAIDSWSQFFNNVGQMGMLVLVIIFCGIMANEFSKGTLINLLTKGLSRKNVVFSKFFSATVIWLVAYLVCFGICYAYTAYFWDDVSIRHGLLVFSAPWLFGVLLIAILMFGGTLFSNIYGSLLSCVAVVIVLNLISIIPNTAKYNPVSLTGGTLAILLESADTSDFIPAMIICVIAIIVLIVATIIVFNRKRI